MLSFILLCILLVGVHCSNTTLPEWKDLECQVREAFKKKGDNTLGGGGGGKIPSSEIRHTMGGGQRPV